TNQGVVSRNTKASISEEVLDSKLHTVDLGFSGVVRDRRSEDSWFIGLVSLDIPESTWLTSQEGVLLLSGSVRNITKLSNPHIVGLGSLDNELIVDSLTMQVVVVECKSSSFQISRRLPHTWTSGCVPNIQPFTVDIFRTDEVDHVLLEDAN